VVEKYLADIAAVTKQDGREESYYRYLAEFIEGYSEQKRNKQVHVTILPKKTEAGNPDFRIVDGKHSQVGYIEAKPPKANLDEIEGSEQLQRYIDTFPNLILTNFYEFRLFRNGKRVDKVLLARPFIASKLKAIPPAEHTDEFLALIEKFLQFSLPTKFTAETLAKELATRTRFLRDQIIKEELREATTSGAQKIHGFYEAFQKYLISNLKPDEFADLYAQTITYGLFAARTRANGAFSRTLAYDFIPKTIGILREIFHFISFDPPEHLAATVDDIAEVLAVADVKNILQQFFLQGKGSDPIYHFYETFLAAYDPKERERRGVYYTPEPVVSYIVRSIDIILKETFGREDGFASQSVTVLDPAGGTLTFLAEAARLAVQEFTEKYGNGSRAKFIEEHVLKHFYAFELMMAPYAAGHLKMGYLLEELGHKLSGDERFQFYLTNTLEIEELVQSSLPGMSALSEESHLAGMVKREKPILVILGNPPYSGHSVNTGDWITEQIEQYKIVDGKPLGEKNPKWLQDDYVKFIRFAQWKIDRMGEGILGFITNHSYLDNPTFRGMRQSLMRSFDEIHILDLHGNSLKKEKAPDGSKDENVFDIQQGVAIAIFVKQKEFKGKKKISHSDVWGEREKKYQWLQKHAIENTRWKSLTPDTPFYFFVPRNENLSRRFQSYASVQEIFPVNSVGIVTSRDDFAIDIDERALRRRINEFRDSSFDDDLIGRSFGLNDSGTWKVKDAREQLRNEENLDRCFSKILYRPFDIRIICYHDAIIERTRKDVMRHMLQPNLSLCAMRQVALHEEYDHFLASEFMVDNRAFNSSKGIIQQYPLYLYPTPKKRKRGIGITMMLFEPEAPYGAKGRVPNIAPKIFESLSAVYLKQPTPEEIFHYIYAVLYSNAYRRKYSEFLKTDFPRVPFTADFKLFQKLAVQGEHLVALHLMKSPVLAKPLAKYEGSGNGTVVKVSYDEKRKRVYINPENYFTGVRDEVWNYHVGGYQVAEKWLKDRKGRILSADEVAHYCKVVTALAETIETQENLDNLFEHVEESVLEIEH
jgi:predicted helicase